MAAARGPALDAAGIIRCAGCPRTEVREFGELYRRAATDLAIARAETRDPKLINYLNSLVIRAHGKIYRAESRGVSLIWQFFSKDFPQTFRKNWRYMAIAFGVFFGFSIFGFVATWFDLDFTHFVGFSGMHERDHSPTTSGGSSLNESNQIGASFIMSNNILVTYAGVCDGGVFRYRRVLRPGV